MAADKPRPLLQNSLVTKGWCKNFPYHKNLQPSINGSGTDFKVTGFWAFVVQMLFQNYQLILVRSWTLDLPYTCLFKNFITEVFFIFYDLKFLHSERAAKTWKNPSNFIWSHWLSSKKVGWFFSNFFWPPQNIWTFTRPMGWESGNVKG